LKALAHRQLGHRRRDPTLNTTALDHPDLSVLYDIGEGADGRLFPIMALYSGETLHLRH